MHLAVEGLGVRHSGGATVLRDLVAASVADARIERVSVFCSPRRERHFEFAPSEKLREIETDSGSGSPARRLFWLYRGLPSQMRQIAADVLISMSGTGFAAPGKAHLPFIQQSLPFSKEGLSRMGLRDRLRMATIRAAMGFASARSAAVLVQTETMRKTVIRAFGTAPERVHSVSSAVSAPAQELNPSPLLEAMRRTPAGCRLLYVGNNSGYKNVEILLSAVGKLAFTRPELRLFLTWPATHLSAWPEHSVPLGFLDESSVSEAYRLATVLVQPSLTETVGLPLLEAMSTGTPVLVADRPYAREICEDAANFFDPLSETSLATAIVNVLENDARRGEMSKRGLELSKERRAKDPYRRMLDLAFHAAQPSFSIAAPSDR